MPKPGAKYNSNHGSWKKQYNEHDMRGGNSGESRRVTFKHSRPNRIDQQKDWGQIHDMLIEDTDNVRFAGGSKTFQNRNRKGGRPGSPAPNKGGGKRKFIDVSKGWFRITLPYGNKYDREFVLSTLLQNLTPLPLIPIMWNVNGNAIIFYVDDSKVADKLQHLDRRIQCPDGYKMIIRVRPGTPYVNVNTAMKEKMKLAMAKRYNSTNKALDLTHFHSDPDLRDFFCALLEPVILLAAVNVISENIPEIEALNLNDNNISLLSNTLRLDKKLPHLKIVHLGNNKIRDIKMLNPFMGLPIEELVLDGNPVCDFYKEQTNYISAVRRILPKVIKLDGINLPPPIGFDISEELSLPPAQQTFLCNAEGQGIVRQFLEQYYQIFDSDSRQPLLQAYHENATFSMTATYPYGQNSSNAPWLNWYNGNSRNLERTRDPDRRSKLLKQGQLAVVSFLAEMPATEHDILGFTVDLSLFTPQMLVLTVSGCFRELRSGHKKPPIRWFYRTLVIVPAGSGFCIANDMLHITNATEVQMKNAFKTSKVEVPSPSIVPSTSTATQSQDVSDDTKQQMVQTMAQQSGMNLEWSRKCLEETNWDFNRAAFIFTELQKQGAIPAEAFVK